MTTSTLAKPGTRMWRAAQEVADAWLGDQPWDGRRLGYVPREPLDMPGAPRLFDTPEDPDPVSYQVLRWKLWSINLEHSDTIKRVSGSPAIVYMDDFATAILAARGDNVVCGTTIQYFTGLADLIVKWTLAHRGESPGIVDGDVFLQNDPYIGAAHQIDTSLYMPVFWQGELFCWLFNCAHQGDLGGMSPGSFCIGARDIFDEPTPVPPVKLMRGGVLQTDVVDLFTRKSRTPDMVALQLRSQIAGLNAAKARVLGLLQRYGAGALGGTMNRMIHDCAQAVKQRLAQLPDGRFEEVTYVSGLTQNDHSPHRFRLSIRKQGELLICSNEGTDAQFGSSNCTYSAWRSAIVCAASSMLAHDQMSCPAGVLSVLRFEPVPGTMNCASHPAAVTTLIATTVSVNLASLTLGRLLLTGPEDVASVAIAAGAGSVLGTWVLNGVDQRGRRCTDVTGDGIAGGFGASRFRDGIDNGGAWFMPGNVCGDVEQWEQSLPMLYLYRREHVDSGGGGRRRGGNGVASAVCGHKTQECEVIRLAIDTSVNATPGLAGGMPGHSGSGQYRADTALPSRLAAGQTPGDGAGLAGLVGELRQTTPMSAMRLLPTDVMTAQVCAAGGFGDSLLREPQRVLDDVLERSVSPQMALAEYGVVLQGQRVDEDATRIWRAGRRLERLEEGQPPAHRHPGRADLTATRRIGDALAVSRIGGRICWACAECGSSLGPVGDNYKLAALKLPVEFERLNHEVYPDPANTCDTPFELRHYACPECATLLATEFCPADAPPHADVLLDEASLDCLLPATGATA